MRRRCKNSVARNRGQRVALYGDLRIATTLIVVLEIVLSRVRTRKGRVMAAVTGGIARLSAIFIALIPQRLLAIEPFGRASPPPDCASR